MGSSTANAAGTLPLAGHPPARSVLEPIRLGRRTARNGVAFAATVNNLGRNLEVTRAQRAFYAARAEGGVGIIVTEGMSPHRTSVPNSTTPLVFDPALFKGLCDLAADVHAHDALLLGQLWHVGRQALWNPSQTPWGVTHARDPYSGTTPHQMSDPEVQEVIEGFISSAQTLQRAGFDGVELHGAHGYLIMQFLSPASNTRDDAWGGSTEHRLRFVREIIGGIRDRCGPEFILGLKLSVDEYVAGGIDVAEAQALVSLLLQTHPVDYLAASQAGFGPTLDAHVPDQFFTAMAFRHHARALREVSRDVPVMALGRISTLAAADDLLATGDADLIGLSRPLIADADLVSKWSAAVAPRPCVFCNECWSLIHVGRPIACFYAPRTGRETIVPRELPSGAAGLAGMPVRIVGAGPVGLIVATLLARAGGQVEVFERRSRIGGRLLDESSVSGLEELGMAVDWLIEDAHAAGVRLRTVAAIDATAAQEWPAAALQIWAAGATARPQPVPGGEVLDLLAVARGDIELAGSGRSLVVIDEIEDEPVYAALTQLARHHRVILLTRQELAGRRLAYVSRIGALRRMDEAGIEIRPLTEAVRLEAGGLLTRHLYSHREVRIEDVDHVLAAGPFLPSSAPAGGDWIVVGDASSPRSRTAVIQEGVDVALALLETYAGLAAT